MATVNTYTDAGVVSVDDSTHPDLITLPKQLGLTSRGQNTHRLKLAADLALTSTTALQSLFGKSFQVEKGKTYRIRARVSLAALSASSGAFSLGFGGTATLGSIQYSAIAVKTPTGTLAASSQVAAKVATAIALVAANTAVAGTIDLNGTFNVTSDGTFIPQIALGVAAVALVEAGSVLEIHEINAVELDGNFI